MSVGIGHLYCYYCGDRDDDDDDGDDEDEDA